MMDVLFETATKIFRETFPIVLGTTIGEFVPSMMLGSMEESISLFLSNEIVARVILHENSPLIGKSLEELALDDNYEFHDLSVKRSGHWLHRPSDELRLKAANTLVVDGYKEGLAELRAANVEAPHSD